MTGVFVDTSVFLLAAGGTHPDRDPCRAFLARTRDQRARLHVSVEAVQEFVFHRLCHNGAGDADAEARALADSCVLHSFDPDVLAGALELIAASQLRGRDAVHAATALAAGFSSIVSLDKDFDEIADLDRVHPGAALA